VIEASIDDARSFLTIDLPAPEAVLDPARLGAIRAAARSVAGDTGTSGTSPRHS